MPEAWESYEQVALFLLNKLATHFGLGHVEGKQLVPGASGTSWEIDAKGVRADGSGFVIIAAALPQHRVSWGAEGIQCGSRDCVDVKVLRADGGVETRSVKG